MAKKSAGLVMIRQRAELELLLVHPGGPFWQNKDAHAWSIPKGEFGDEEDPHAAAVREFEEETGLKAAGPWIALGSSKPSGGKIIFAWAFHGDCDPTTVRSNTFKLEWPPHSGLQREYPEIDQAAWFSLSDAKEKLHKNQAWIVDALRKATT